MSIVLSPEVEQQIEELVKSGEFASADDFVRRSVAQYREERAWIAELAGREDIQRQLEEAEEDVRCHERKGIAGDWRNHFTERVKLGFKHRFGDVLLATGYERDNDW